MFAAAIGVAACANDVNEAEACSAYCEARAECCATAQGACRDTDDIPTCKSTCRSLADDDPEYASAIADKAQCFADVEPPEEYCVEVMFGCLADGT